MDNTVALILLRALHRAANQFLKEGVVAAISALEEQQERRRLPDGYQPHPVVERHRYQPEHIGGPAPR